MLMENTPTTAGRFVSLRIKVLVGFTLIFSLVFAAAFYWFYTFAEQVAMTRIREDLTATLQAAADGSNGDLLLDLAANGQPNAAGFSDDARYTELINWLETVHKIEPRAWPYLYIPGQKEKEIIYIVDLWARYDPNRATRFHEEFTSKKGFLSSGLKEQTLNTTNGVFKDYQDEWGRWVSAYTPVKNAKGELVGGIGIDFQAEYVDQVRQTVINSVLYAFLLAYGILFLLVFVAAGALTRPIIKLTAVAQRIGEGDYNQDLSGLNRGYLRDEINSLIHVFDIMIDKVHEREQTLRHQVEELRIEIDEAKRHAQVSEIVDTDFFRDLRSKAQSMRSRSRKQTSSDDPDQSTDEPNE